MTTTTTTPAPICVFCGSSPGISPIYLTSARSLGAALAQSSHTLVYGGGARGLMGAVADATLEAGGRVVGVIPKALSAPGRLQNGRGEDLEGNRTGKGEGTGQVFLQGGDYGGRFETEVVNSMHERKTRMAQISTGGFIVLPGGFGTFEEVMEMVTWNQLSIHRLPVVVLNTVSEGFISPINASLIRIVDLPEGAGEEEWGRVGVREVEGWEWEAGAGYKLDWKIEES